MFACGVSHAGSMRLGVEIPFFQSGYCYCIFIANGFSAVNHLLTICCDFLAKENVGNFTVFYWDIWVV